MAQEEGLVASITEDGWAQVVSERRDACADCGASHCCASLGGGSKMVIKALNRVGARVGDLVAINLKSGAVIQSAVIFYIIPIIGLIAGAAIGTSSNLGLPIGESLPAILFGFVGLGLGFAVTALLTRWLSARREFTPVITRVIKAGMQATQTVLAVDPVCKMVVDPEGAPAHFTYLGKTYYFCHPACKESFAKDPEKYLQDSPFQK